VKATALWQDDIVPLVYLNGQFDSLSGKRA
jgi:hypothetical protein